jgi:hypothetical protein
MSSWSGEGIIEQIPGKVNPYSKETASWCPYCISHCKNLQGQATSLGEVPFLRS